MNYYKSKGNRLFLNDNIFIDTSDNQIMPACGEINTDFYVKCTKGEWLLAYKKVIEQLNKAAGLR